MPGNCIYCTAALSANGGLAWTTGIVRVLRDVCIRVKISGEESVFACIVDVNQAAFFKPSGKSAAARWS
jgi:DNA mismatch repair protein MutH